MSRTATGIARVREFGEGLPPQLIEMQRQWNRTMDTILDTMYLSYFSEDAIEWKLWTLANPCRTPKWRK